MNKKTEYTCFFMTYYIKNGTCQCNAVNVQIDFGVLMVPMSLSFCWNFDRFYVVIINECQINLFDFLPVTNEFYDIH